MSMYVKNEKSYKKNISRYKSRKIIKPEYYTCDFETTVDENPTVWSAAVVKFYTEDVKIYDSIFDFFENEINYTSVNKRVYFHNLKFDGSFIIPYLLKNGYESTTSEESEGKKTINLQCGEFKYLISSLGVWYCIVLKNFNNATIEIYDSLKILPFSLKYVCEQFKVKHQKTTMVYTGKASLSQCSDADITYIKNDVLGLKECLEIFDNEYGLENMTIGSACVRLFKREYYKSGFGRTYRYNDVFVPVEKCTLSNFYKKLFKIDDMEQLIRKSYKGGFCYVNEKYAGLQLNGYGITFDVNSLYPFIMHNRNFPYGRGTCFEGECDYYFKKHFLRRENYYVFHVIDVNDCYLKRGKIPTLQIKGDLRFRGNEWLKKITLAEPKRLVLTETDYTLFIENYEIGTLIHVGGVYFKKTYNCPIFRSYVEKFMKIKESSTGARRTIAKLFLNNLYGKFATSRCKDYKILDYSDGKACYKTVFANELKKSEYIPIGSAITSYAREYTIRTAQENFNNFIYADTDSLHLFFKSKDFFNISGIEIHATKLGKWAIENEYTSAKYLRQKTYCEISGDGKINLIAAGMDNDCKQKVIDIIKKGGLKEFKRGIKIEGGKLITELYDSGTLLKRVDFHLR